MPQGSNPAIGMDVIRDMLMGKDPQPVYDEFYRKYPEFRQLVDSTSGMTPQQAFQANGRDFDRDVGQLMQMLGLGNR